MLRHIFLLMFLAPILYGKPTSNENLSNNFAVTKERPELNPILSALINEDVMRSIESKRAAEIEEKDSILANQRNGLVLTTTAPKTETSNDDDQLLANDGLLEQGSSLETAGSEQNQKSQLQVRKGPNGVDYEYEYIYYYYDDDGNPTGNKSKSSTEDSSSSASSATSVDNAISPAKTAYTSIDRSTTSAPDNEIAKDTKDAKDVEEGRLPFITRFPPRANDISGEADGAATEGDSSAGSSSTSSGKKIVRPGLDLVDSDTFNTNEKQVKSNRNLENEVNKLAAEEGKTKMPKETASSDTPKAEVSSESDDTESDVKPTEDSLLDVDSTTVTGEKVAMDMAEMAGSDMTTEENAESTSEPTDEGTTMATANPEPSTTPTATTPEPTTTTTTTTTTEAPTTTTAKASPLAPAGRRGLSSGGRNRFRLNAAASTSTEAPANEETERSVKTKNRFQRPSFGGRSKQTTSAPANEPQAKEENKSTSSSGVLRGRTRNRFNLRGQVTTEKSANENSVDTQSTATTAKSSKGGRPTFSGRRRGRPSASSAPADTNDGGNEDKAEEKPTQSSAALPTRASRFNLNRPAIGGNRLLPGRGRPGGLRPNLPTAAADKEAEKKTEEAPADGVTETTVSSSDTSNSENSESQPETTTQATGLNRIRNRPRIQINPKAAEKPKSQASIPNRKISPLLPRRKISLGSTTTEAAPEAEEGAEEEAEEKPEEKAEEPKEEEQEQPEVTSEQPRGLGLLGNRRRLQLRKPGTLL